MAILKKVLIDRWLIKKMLAAEPFSANFDI